MEIMCPRGSRPGSPYTPSRRSTSAANPVSSSTSRSTASSSDSPNATKPPGSAYRPRNGSFPRRTSTSCRPWRSTASTATRGTSQPTDSLQARRPDARLLRERDRVLVPCVRMAHDPQPRVRREHAFDSRGRPLRPVAHDERARVRGEADADAATLLHRHKVPPPPRVEERVQDRPARNRVPPVLHPLRLSIRRGDAPRVEVVPRNHDRSAELLVP